MAAIPGEGVNDVVTVGVLLSELIVSFPLGDLREADARLAPPPGDFDGVDNGVDGAVEGNDDIGFVDEAADEIKMGASIFGGEGGRIAVDGVASDMRIGDAGDSVSCSLPSLSRWLDLGKRNRRRRR